jgi:hypothetical protein
MYTEPPRQALLVSREGYTDGHRITQRDRRVLVQADSLPARFGFPVLLLQRIGQAFADTLVSGVSQGALLVQVVAVGQQIGEGVSGIVVPVIGPGAQEVLGRV